MSNKLFVGGLAWATTDESLRAAFEPYGEVVDARVIVDRETGRSRGFGFVTFRQAEDAKKAIESMHGADVDGRSIRVNEAQERAGGGGGPRGPGGPPGGRPGGPPDRRPGGPPRGEGRPGGGRDYPPVERRGGEGRASGPGGGYGGGGGGYGGGGGGGGGGASGGGSSGPFDPNGKPAGRKRHNGGTAGAKRKGVRKDQDEGDFGGGAAGGRKRRGGGNRRRFDDTYGDW